MTPSSLILRQGGEDGTASFSEDFKRDGVAQITERGYPVAEVSQRLGVSPHSLYACKTTFAKPSGSSDADQAGEAKHGRTCSNISRCSTIASLWTGCATRQAEVDGCVAALRAELTAAKDKLRWLYKLVENGVTDLDEMLKERRAALKVDRDRAQAALDGMHTAERPPAIMARERSCSLAS